MGVKIGQKILGGLLWLSTRTCPDLSYSVSSAAQVLTKDIELLKVKLRHLLQYLNTVWETLPVWIYHSSLLWLYQTSHSLAVSERE